MVVERDVKGEEKKINSAPRKYSRELACGTAIKKRY